MKLAMAGYERGYFGLRKSHSANSVTATAKVSFVRHAMCEFER